jgi:hypothetical protein
MYLVPIPWKIIRSEQVVQDFLNTNGVVFEPLPRLG